MNVATRWYNDEKTVIITEFVGDWVWEHYELIRKSYREMMDSVNHPIDQIYDFSKSETTPSQLIVKFWNVAVTKHRSIVVVVGRTRLGEILTNSISKVVQLTDRKFDSKTVQLVEKEITVNYDLDVFNEQIHQSVENAWNILIC